MDTKLFIDKRNRYKQLEAKYGSQFCIEAGYFDEDRAWLDDYSSITKLPKYETVIQFSGAFYPFHNGHLETCKKAIDAVIASTGTKSGVVILHVDHHRYRWSKGSYDEDLFNNAFADLTNYRNFKFQVILEDKMFLSCSRNFTWLYDELSVDNQVYFLCGGDRANFALTFIDEGNCIVAGRDNHSNYEKYKHLENDRIWFLDGNDVTSSTEIRSKYNANK